MSEETQEQSDARYQKYRDSINLPNLLMEFGRCNFRHVNDTEHPWGRMSEAYCVAVVEELEAMQAVIEAARNYFKHGGFKVAVEGAIERLDAFRAAKDRKP